MELGVNIPDALRRIWDGGYENDFGDGSTPLNSSTAALSSL